jgi:hypothetical protein
LVSKRLLSALLLLCALPCGSIALASKPRLRLERVDRSRCNREGTIDLYLAEIELEGILRPPAPSRYRLVVDSKELDSKPVDTTTFGRSGRSLRLALVIETTVSYEADLERIKAGARDLLGVLPQATRVTVLTYDWQARRLLSNGTARQAQQVVDGIEPGTGLNPALDEALTLALRALSSGPRAPAGRSGMRQPSSAKQRERPLLVLVSDGINRLPKRDLFRGLGSRAGAMGVAIYPIAFSPIDERGPLLNLGELAKRSRGTLRWARRPGDLRGELANLGREINGQLVLTYALPSWCERPHRIQVRSGQLVSNPVETPAMKKLPRPQERGVVRIVVFAGVLLLVLAGLLLLVRVMLRPSGRKPPA